jgi:hypothetical protein
LAFALTVISGKYCAEDFESPSNEVTPIELAKMSNHPDDNLLRQILCVMVRQTRATVILVGQRGEYIGHSLDGALLAGQDISGQGRPFKVALWRIHSAFQ